MLHRSKSRTSEHSRQVRKSLPPLAAPSGYQEIVESTSFRLNVPSAEACVPTPEAKPAPPPGLQSSSADIRFIISEAGPVRG